MQNMDEISLSAGDTLPEGLLADAKPLILRGYVRHWPMVEKALQGTDAIMQHLLQFYHDSPVHLMRGEAKDKGRLFYTDDLTGFNFSRCRVNLRDVFKELADKAQDTLYVGSTAIDKAFPKLRLDNDLAALSDKALVSIWMGNQSRVAAHYDAPDNIACVVAGRRRFTLFPPNQTDNLYIGPLDFTPAGQPASLVDFHNPDYERFPKFKQAQEHGLVAELEPGDAIFVPSMWWHHVEGLSDFNILVNYWWRQVDNYIGAPADALFHAILSIRELPEEQRQYWQEVFDYYVFNPTEQSHIPEYRRGLLNPLDANSARALRGLLINKLNR